MNGREDDCSKAFNRCSDSSIADAESKEAEDIVQQQADDSESKEEPDTGAKKF